MTDYPNLTEDEIPENLDPMMSAMLNEEVPKDFKKVIEVFGKIAQIDMETIDDLLSDLNRQETVGPITNPSDWRGNKFEQSTRAKKRLRKLKELKEVL